MPLSRLENFLVNTDGNILYVNPSDLDATDSFDNKGNSLTRPFVTIQRALIEAARFSYQSGQNNDKFDKTTILLYPGTHYIDNRPGYYIKNNSGVVEYYDVNKTIVASPDIELTNSSIFDISNANNILYKFNSVDGGIIIPKGTSIIGLDLRKTKVKPLYVPDPEDSLVERSAIFRVTGGCYFWQFSVFDADTSVFYNYDYSKKASPSYSHHKLTVFEYADGVNLKSLTGTSDLQMYYYKLMNAYGDDTGNREITDYPSTNDFQPNSPEFKIVGDLSSNDIGISSLTASSTTAIVTTLKEHNLSVDDSIRIAGIGSALYNGSFKVNGVTNTTQFTYQLPSTPNDLVININTGNERVIIESDNVDGASPYIFNCSMRSSYGMCGLHADGSKATGFRSMVVAQFTGIGLQKDDNAFIIYNESTGLYDTNATTLLANKPLHVNQEAIYKPSYENYHIKASNDAFIQDVSVFAIGFSQHFLAEDGADQSITNSNSNFGAKSLISKGFRRESFDRDDTGYVTHIIPPKDLQENSFNVLWKTFDVGLTTSHTGVGQTSRLYLLDEKDFNNPPSNITNGFRVGAKTDEKIYLNVNLDGVDATYSSPVLMQSPSGDGTSSQKEITVSRTSNSNDITSDVITLTSNHNFYSSESVRIFSDDAIVPDGLENGALYYIITTGTQNQIKLAKTVNDVNNSKAVSIKNKKGGILTLVSKVSDKKPGDPGHPIQYDPSKNNWYLISSSSTSTNKIYEAFKNYSSVISANNSSSYIQRKSENRDLTDRIYKLRYVIPKEFKNAKPPVKNYILQESKSVGTTNLTISMVNERNPHVIANITSNGSIVTVTTEIPHRLSVNDKIRIRKVISSTNLSAADDAGFNGYFTVTSTPSSKTFSFVNPYNGGTFVNNVSTRGDSLPVFSRNEYDTTYTIQNVETIQEYSSEVQDGIYYLTCLIGNISPTAAEFSNQKFKQNISDLYPVSDKDNLITDPNQSLTNASNKLIGKVIVNDPQNSITKETIINYLKDNRIGFAVTNAISNSSGISTLFCATQHNLNSINSLSVTTPGSGYSSGVSTTLYNISLTGGTGDGATGNISVSAAGTITAVAIVDPGSAYTVGNVLTVASGNNNGTVTVSSINSNIGDVVQVIGVGTTSNRNNSNYNGLYKITAINDPKTITYNTGSNPGIYTTSSGIFYVVDKSVSISSIVGIPNATSAGIVTITTSSTHGLSIGNKIKITGVTGTAATIYNSDFIVRERIGLTTFTILSPIAIGTAAGSAELYKYGLNSYGEDTSLKSEKISGSLVSLNAGLRFSLSADLNSTSGTITLVSTEGLLKGDFIQLNDEICRVQSNDSLTQITVIRGVLGTNSFTHSSGTVIRKINPIPSETRRFTSIRASGHTFEYLGYGPGNYSTAFPQKQNRVITEEEEHLSVSKEEKGGVVFFSGMNDRGDFFTGDRLTGKERFVGEVTSDSSSTYDDVYIRNTLRVGGGPNRLLPSEFRGPVNFTNKITSTSSDGIEAIKLLLKGNSTQNPFLQIGPDSSPSLVIKQSNQNVGIKTSDPSYEFDVNGSIRANTYENFKLSDLPTTDETTFDANRILKVKNDGSGYELVDPHDLESYSLNSFKVSNDGTVYSGTGSNVSNKFRVSGISTSKFYVGQKVKLFGVSPANYSATIVSPTGTATTVGNSGSTIYRYWVSQYHLRNGHVGPSTNITPTGIGMTSIDNFNSQNHIALNLTVSDPNYGILVYRQIGQNADINQAKLIAILGEKEISQTQFTWIDYGTYDQTEWSEKGTVNEYGSGQIHFPNIATTGSSRGWNIDQIVSIGSSYIGFNTSYTANSNNIIKVVHDNTYALSEVIDHSIQLGQNSLNLPSGTYITNKLIIPSGFTLRGNGKNTIIKKQYFANDVTDGGGNALDFSGNCVGIGTTNNGTDVTVENITFDGNKVNNILFSDDSDNYLLYFKDLKSSIFKNIEIRNSSADGLYLENSSRISIEDSSIVDGSTTDRYSFQPLGAKGSDVLRINDCLFENYPGPVDLTATSVVSTGGNIIRNCGTGLRIYASGKITTTNNIILGPSDEYIPSPDIYNSDYNSINITIDNNTDFYGPTLLYLENGSPKDLSSAKVSISAGIGTIINSGTINEYLGNKFLSFDIDTTDQDRQNGNIRLKLTKVKAQSLTIGSSLGYDIIGVEFLDIPSSLTSRIGIQTGSWNAIGAGQTYYTVTLAESSQFTAISTGDVVKLVNHSVSPDLSTYEMSVSEKITEGQYRKLKLVGFTTTSETNGNQSGYIVIKNTFTIAKGRVGVI